MSSGGQRVYDSPATGGRIAADDEVHDDNNEQSNGKMKPRERDGSTMVFKRPVS
jgi:hypothetical protein